MKVKLVKHPYRGQLVLVTEDNVILKHQVGLTIDNLQRSKDIITVNCEFVFNAKDFKIEDLEG